MLPPAAPEVQAVIDRLAFEDAEIAATARIRAGQLQELAAQEREARDERARLAEAHRVGSLVVEEHGHDRHGRPTVERKTDSARLKAADARVDAIARKKALVTSVAPIARLTATRLQSELAKYRLADLVVVERPSLPLTKNERATDALPRFRQLTLALCAEHRTVEDAPRTLKEVEREAHAEIDRIADRGLPKTMRLFHGGTIEWPRHEISASHQRVPDGVALAAFLLRDELKGKISALLGINASAFPDALSAEEKAERLADLEAEIDAAERVEAACVEQIVADGGKAYHRPDASVLAVLSSRAGH